VTQYHWRRGGSGLYFLRDHAGLGEALGAVKRVPLDSGASFYKGTFEHAGVQITLQERGTPATFIARMEMAIREAIPDATFTKIGF
jgi:hypothetical protein